MTVPIAEVGLPDYRTVQDFARATQQTFPEDTQFTVTVKRVSLPEFDGDDVILSEQAAVDTSFVKGGMTGQISRTFHRDHDGSLIAKHAGFVIQGEGIGKSVLKAQFDQYEKLGVTKLKVHANIDVGGYAWARFGFVPSQRSWDELRESMKYWVNADKVTQDWMGNEYPPLNLSPAHRKHLTRIFDDPDPRGIWQIAAVAGVRIAVRRLTPARSRGRL